MTILRGYECNREHVLNDKPLWFTTYDELDQHMREFHWSQWYTNSRVGRR